MLCRLMKYKVTLTVLHLHLLMRRCINSQRIWKTMVVSNNGWPLPDKQVCVIS